MKVALKESEEKVFKPFTLEILVESEEEAAQLYALCNNIAISDAIKRVNTDGIMRVLEDRVSGVCKLSNETGNRLISICKGR